MSEELKTLENEIPIIYIESDAEHEEYLASLRAVENAAQNKIEETLRLQEEAISKLITLGLTEKEAKALAGIN